MREFSRTSAGIDQSRWSALSNGARSHEQNEKRDIWSGRNFPHKKFTNPGTNPGHKSFAGCAPQYDSDYDDPDLGGFGGWG